MDPAKDKYRCPPCCPWYRDRRRIYQSVYQRIISDNEEEGGYKFPCTGRRSLPSYRLSDSDLSPEQRVKLESLLTKHSSVFSTSDDDIGYSETVRDRISTEDDITVTQPYGRIPGVSTNSLKTTFRSICIHQSFAEVISLIHLLWLSSSVCRLPKAQSEDEERLLPTAQNRRIARCSQRCSIFHNFRSCKWLQSGRT